MVYANVIAEKKSNKEAYNFQKKCKKKTKLKAIDLKLKVTNLNFGQ